MEITQNNTDFIVSFYRRFVCGGEALTKLRSVSRKRLVLVRLKLSDDLDARSLQSRINTYEQAVQSFNNSSEVSPQLLEQIHKKLTKDETKAGGFRKAQNWIGDIPTNAPLDKALKQARYVPPPPENVPGLMKHWCNQVNTSKQPSIAQSIALYANLVLIHPFADANGRIARAFCDAQLLKAERNIPSLALHRLNCEPDDYFSALYALEGHFISQTPGDYWEAVISFSESLLKRASSLLKQCADALNNRLILSNPGTLELEIVKKLVEQPILEPVSFQVQHQCTPTTLKGALSKLTAAGVLQPQLTPSQRKVFVSEPVLETWQKMDELAFSNHLI